MMLFNLILSVFYLKLSNGNACFQKHTDLGL